MFSVYVGDEIPPIYIGIFYDFFINQCFRIHINQPVFQWKVSEDIRGFFSWLRWSIMPRLGEVFFVWWHFLFTPEVWQQLGCADRDEHMSHGWPFSLLNDEKRLQQGWFLVRTNQASLPLKSYTKKPTKGSRILFQSHPFFRGKLLKFTPCVFFLCFCGSQNLPAKSC